MSECDLEEIPEDRKEETPFNCPHCKHQMSVLDEDFDDNVEVITMADRFVLPNRLPHLQDVAQEHLCCNLPKS